MLVRVMFSVLLCLAYCTVAVAQDQGTGQQAPGAPGGGGGGAGGMLGFLPIVFVIAIFYFLLIAPQRKQQKRHMERLQQLKKGDKVMTAGGIVATVVTRGDQVSTVRIADKVEVEVQTSTIQAVFGQEGKSKE